MILGFARSGSSWIAGRLFRRTEKKLRSGSAMFTRITISTAGESGRIYAAFPEGLRRSRLRDVA